jgi:hypothetical protein
MTHARWTVSGAVALALAITAVNLLRGVTPPRPAAPRSQLQVPLDEQACAACHSEVVQQFATTPHRRTLTPGTDDSLRQAFTEASQLQAREFGEYRLLQDRLTVISPLAGQTFPVDWVFGSGHHARTPVTLDRDLQGRTTLLEHRLSWYPGVSAGLVDFTLGNAAAGTASAGTEACGKSLNSDATAECFGCHTTFLPFDGPAIAWNKLVPGVRCARCHLTDRAHVAAAERGAHDLRMDSWKSLSPRDSIRRCGECHRRADQLTPDELRTDNLMLVRFAPVGLEQSRCFQQQSTKRLDCVTCHDPHRPAETDPAFYSAQCAVCHTGASPQEPRCRVEPAATDCIRCHLPKVEVQPHLKLSDHWIRIRETVHTPGTE